MDKEQRQRCACDQPSSCRPRLSLHLRYSIMRWHSNTRGSGFQADIICMLLDTGATCLEVNVPAVNHAASGALTWKNVLSVAHTLTDILIRRLAQKVYAAERCRLV